PAGDGAASVSNDRSSDTPAAARPPAPRRRATSLLTAMSAWQHDSLAMRVEAHFGDRLVRCYGNRPRTLTQMLSEAATRHHDGDALVYGNRRLTWGEVERQVARLAGALRRRGLEPGQRLALFLENGIEFPLTMLAAARIGAIAVPIGHRCQEPEVRYV